MASKKKLPTGVYPDRDGVHYRVTVPAYRGGPQAHYYGFKTVHDAQAYRLACKKAVAERRPHPVRTDQADATGRPAGKPLTVEEAINGFIKFKRGTVSVTQWRSYGVYRAVVLRWCTENGKTNADQLKASDLEALGLWLQTTRRGGELRAYSHATASTIIWLVKKSLQRAHRDELIPKDVTATVSVPKPRTGPTNDPALKSPDRTWTLPEAARIAGALHPQWRAVHWLCFFGGTRRAEALGPLICDFDRQQGTLRIAAQAGKKYEQWEEDSGQFVISDDAVHRKEELKTPTSFRTMHLPWALVEEIGRHIDEYHGDDPDPEAPLFVTPTAIEWAADAFSKTYKVARDQAGLSPDEVGFNSTPHHLRKCTVSILTARGVDGRSISAYVGHKNRATDGQAAVTAEVYTLTVESTRRRCADELDELINKELGGTLHIEDRTDLLDTKAVAARLECTRSNIYARVKSGSLPTTHNPLATGTGISIWFAPEDVDALLENRNRAA